MNLDPMTANGIIEAIETLDARLRDAQILHQGGHAVCPACAAMSLLHQMVDLRPKIWAAVTGEPVEPSR